VSYITIDIETECTAAGCTGKGCKHALNPATDRITVVALKHPDWEVVTRDLSEVASLIKNQPLVAFNFKFEHLHLNHHGVEVRLDQWVADPFLMAYVSTDKIPSEWLEMYEANRPDGHRKAGKHSLKTLAPYFLKVAPYWEVEQKDDDEYVMTDVRYTEQLHEYFIEHMPHDQFCFYQDKLMAWTKMLVEAEMRGIAIDLDALTAKEQELAARAVELRAKLDEQWRDAHDAYHGEQVTKVMLKYKEQKRNVSWERRQAAAIDKAPRAVDYDSPKQMLWLLQTHLGYDCTSFEGAESTGKEVLQRLSAEHADVAVYLEWRGVNKLLSAFLPTYRELGASGVVRPVFNPGNTRTGRTSSERPNMQQIPEGLRKLFHARPGYQLVGYDMGAIEAKLIAYYTDDETLTSLIKT
jgi:DNA polymerase I-like protein with 3'-5' exonuclease and polymerase domains